jgi:hypothetical protein
VRAAVAQAGAAASGGVVRPLVFRGAVNSRRLAEPSA